MGDGTFGPDGWGCNCINATIDGQVPCDVGQSCFWCKYPKYGTRIHGIDILYIFVTRHQHKVLSFFGEL